MKELVLRDYDGKREDDPVEDDNEVEGDDEEEDGECCQDGNQEFDIDEVWREVFFMKFYILCPAKKKTVVELLKVWNQIVMSELENIMLNFTFKMTIS